MAFADPWPRLTGFYQRKVASLACRRPFSVHPQRPLISFTFDDFPRSAIHTGGAILNRFGVAGTYYAALGLIDKLTPSGQIFSVDDLPALFEQGHELGCHTFAHCDSWGTPTEVFEQSDLNQLSAYFVEKTRDNFQAIKDIIDENRRACGWLIFATHDVVEDHTPFGCAPEFFHNVVQYAVSSGAQIVPVVEALNILGAPGCD